MKNTTELDDYKRLVTKSIIDTATKLTELIIKADIPYKLRLEIDQEHPDVEKIMDYHGRNLD